MSLGEDKKTNKKPQGDTASYLLGWLWLCAHKPEVSVGGNVEKLECLCAAGGNV